MQYSGAIPGTQIRTKLIFGYFVIAALFDGSHLLS